MGLLMNGLVKVPMQFAILLIGALVFTFYQFNNAPLFFNQSQLNKLESTSHKDSLSIAKKTYNDLSDQKKATVTLFANAETKEEKDNKAIALSQLQHQSDSIRKKVKTWMQAEKIEGDTSDTNYIFLRFVVDNLPKGMVAVSYTHLTLPTILRV